MSTKTSPNPQSHESAQARHSSPIVIDGISYIPSSVVLTGTPKTSFKDNRAFAVMDLQGEAPRLYSQGSELGIYFNDTRHLNVWETSFNGTTPVALAHELRFGGNTVVFSMTNPDLAVPGGNGRIPRDMLLIRRILALVEDRLFEMVEVKNFDSVPHLLQIEQWAGSKFDDVFEVRGYPREKRGRMLGPGESSEKGVRSTTLQYEGLDGKIRRTLISRFFEAEKIRVSPGLVGYFTRLEIPPKETALLRTAVSFDEQEQSLTGGKSFAHLKVPEFMQEIAASQRTSLFSGTRFNSDNAIVNRSLQNAELDIFMLLSQEKGLLYPYAGIPWFSAPFGRDGMITAYQSLPWFPDLAKGVLEFGFRHLGSKEDAFTDEQPGKVFHELRRGEMAQTREVPFIPYYGSVDSTPLCLILLHEYVRWTLDLESLRRWWPQALAALRWMEKWGDSDGDGFLEYAKQSPTGLINQGWKDSHNSIMHEDGGLAEAPIRLCEAQGYAFRARMGMAELARLLGDPTLSSRLRLEALRLKTRFAQQFWDDAGKFIVLALDRDRKPCRVKASNMGHCLWSQILSSEHARMIAGHLVSDSMFSGYGIRTLADTEVAYNPLSYHNGSVWPHDNSLIMEGLRFYGRGPELEKLCLGLLGVLEASQDFRLPELFCGFRKRENAPPVPYEVACKPQAWAAGSIFLMLKAILGVSIDTDQSHLVLNSPLLTNKMNWLELKGLRGRDWELDLVFRRSKTGTTIDIQRRQGSVRVLTVR